MTQLPLSDRTSSQISFSKMFRCTRSPLSLEAMLPLTASCRMLLSWKGWLEPQLKKSVETYSIPEEPSGATGPQAAQILLSVPSTLVPDERCFFFHGLEKPSFDSPPAPTDAFIKTRIENPLVRLRRIRKMKYGLEFCPPLIMDLRVHMSARLKSLLCFILKSQNFSV